LESLIEEHIKDVKVIFTRKTDVFVELEDRAKIANDNNADLFISIHCNAAGKPVMVKDKKTGKMRPKTFKNSKGKLIVVETANPEPFGSETYVMGLKNEEGKMKVAQRENSAMLLEDNYETKYQGFDPNSEESYIIMSNYTSSYVIQSAGLALKIQDQYLNKAGRVDKGVHRQSIWVLWRTSMPSVLTEIGYLTNPQEEKFLGSEKGQTYLAACLFRAFRKYKDEQEGTKKTYNDEIENQVPLEKEKYTIAEVKEEKANEKVEEEAEEEVKKENAENKELKDKEEALAESSAKAKLEAEQKAKAEAAKEKAIADAKAKEEADIKAKEDARIKKANADSLAEVQKAKTKADELEKKYKQLITMADLNFKNKNYTESLDLFQKANAVKGNNDAYATKKIKEIEELNNAASVKTNTVAEVKETDKPKAEINKSGIVFKVQFAATDKEVDAKTKFPNVTEVWFYKVGAVVKYTSGNFNFL
jgi:N-acetylmuramoyl-L-alanine amidase